MSVNCNLCGSDAAKDFFRIYSSVFGAFRSYRVVRCTKCRLAYLNPPPIEEEILSMYKNRYYELVNRPDVADDGKVHFSESHLAWQKSMLDRLERYVPKGLICDIGCGYGALLNLARTRGWEGFGIEPSSQFADYARDVLGISVFRGILKERAFPESFFDAVHLNNVIEHYSDPHGELSEINRILKPDGILQVLTPNIMGLTERGSRLYFKLKGRKVLEEDTLLQHL